MIRLKTASALTALAIASIATNAGAAGFVTAGANMADGKNGYIYQSIFTTGETVGGYTPIGLMDGIGAYALNKDTVRVLVAHEAANNRGSNYTLANGTSLAGARMSYFDIDNLDVYYTDCVITGIGAFVVPIRERHQFVEATKTKLVREIASGKGLNRVMPLDGSVTEGSLLNTGMPEISTAPASVNANSLNSFPVMPVRKPMGA